MIHTNWSRPCSDMGVLSEKGRRSLRVEIPSTAVDQIYYRIERNLIECSDDLRQMVRPTDTLDERAIYSLLQFGAVIPPLSPWESVSRAVPGRTTIFRDDPAGIEETEFRLRKVRTEGSSTLDLDHQISVVLDTLDSSLIAARRERRVIILFSGGVDSGLLAARAAALGMDDTVLVNYSFGKNDPESLLAEKMARHLGLSFQKIQDIDSGLDVDDVLIHAGRDYRTPFCDSSAVPTGRLVRSVIRTFGSEFAFFEGTGADGAFGLFGRSRQWQNVHSIPSGFLRFGSMVYALSRLWKRDANIEYWFRILRRASQHRYPLSAVAQNPLAGIAYRFPKQISGEVESLGISWLDSISPQIPRLQLAALDMSLVCSCIFAQKSKSLFATSKVDVIYPYLSPQMVDIALSSGSWEGSDGDAKWLLKAALARQVPPHMVYRPKRGFEAPMNEKFASPAFIDALDKVLAGKSQLSPYLEKQFLRDIKAKLNNKAGLPIQTTATVWGIVFASEWLEQVTSFESREALDGKAVGDALTSAIP